MRRLALLVLIGCSSNKPVPPQSPFEAFDALAPRVGDLAPDFTLADVDGHTVELSDAVVHGPVVLVWGSFT